MASKPEWITPPADLPLGRTGLAAIMAERRRIAQLQTLERAQDHAEEVREKCAKLIGFVEEAWRILEPSKKFASGWAIEAMCDLLERVTRGQIQYLLINVPPGMMKSLLLVFWTAWEWGPCGRPDLSYLATSYSKDNLDRDSDKIRKLVSSDWYKSLWPEVALRRERNAIDLFELTHGGWHDSRPFASMTGGRADRTKIDDPHSVEGAESDAQRAGTIRKFREGISDRLNDLRTSVMVIIMQRVHEGDVSGVVLELDIGFVHLCLPMEYDPKRHCEIVIDGEVIFSDPRTKTGELLFEERFPRPEVDRMRRIKGEYAWSSQYDQLPTPRSGGMFKPDMIEIVDAIPHGVVDWCRGWDLAASTDGDWTAGLLLGKLRDGRFIIADVRRERYLSDLRDALIKNTAASDGKDIKISVPQEPGAAGKTLAISHARLLAGYRVEVSPEKGEKEIRADPVSSQVNVGNFMMLRGDWNRAFIDEMRVFPMGKYDDQIDALSRAFKKLVFGVQKSLIAAPIVVSGVRPSQG